MKTNHKPGIPGLSLKQFGYMVVADIGYALALDLFYVDNGIAAGGLAGLATVIKGFTGWPVGLMVLIMSIPIVVVGIIVKGWGYTAMALIATAIYSLIVDMLSFLPTLTDDMLVAVICGGILYGVSASLMVKVKISSGGTDLLAKILITKFKSMTIGTLLMAIDGSVVVIATIANRNIELGIYAILAIATCSVVTDTISKGFNKAQIFYIFASKNTSEISDEILYEMGRGVTALYGTGKYSNEGKEILMVVVSPQETPTLKAIVHKHDPSAFIALVPANEIIGQGFEDTDITMTKNEERKYENHN